MATSRTAIVVDAEALAADVSTIDALARLQLNAQRIGQMIRLHNASTELRQLIEFAGLSEVLRVEPRGQTEQREEPLGVEEEGELPDSAA
jgi:ABC-type transporter Mla MlaB component